ncbi:hypothetical protein GC207_00940 [bacterium]|nr:hypothetical protein [bacterium]
MVVIVFLLFIGLELVDAIRSFLAADGSRYFASHPHRLLYVVGIALAAGGVILMVAKFSSRHHTLDLIVVGSLAVTTTCFLGIFAIDYVKLSITPSEKGIGDDMLFPTFAFLLAALLFWYEFAALWGQTRSLSKPDE